MLAPVGDSALLAAAAQPRPAPGRGHRPSAEDPSLRWHPAAAALATLHGEGKVSAFPAIGYDHPDQSHFTSRHYYEIGELEVGFRTGWLGRYLDLVGDDDNPLQGLSMDGSPLADDRHRRQAGRGDRQRRRLRPLVARSAEPVADEMFRSFAPLRLAAARTRPALAQVRRATAQTDKLRQDLGGVGDFTSPVTYPETGFAHKLAGLAAYIAVGLPMQVVTIRAPGGYDTHADQAATSTRNLQRDLRGDPRLPARPRGPRPRRPGPDRDVERVRPPAGGERLAGHRPRRRRLRLRDRLQAKGEMVGEFPGLATLDPHDNLRVTSDFRAMYCSLLEQWLGHDAGPIIPGASGFARPALVKA